MLRLKQGRETEVVVLAIYPFRMTGAMKTKSTVGSARSSKKVYLVWEIVLNLSFSAI